MANFNVDYTTLPGKANSMRTTAQELNTELATSYNNIITLHTHWYGKRYNVLVNSFNTLRPEINELLKLVVYEIPVALETIANNYSQADCGTNAVAVNETLNVNIAELAIYEDQDMKFDTANVETIKTNVTTNFTNAKDDMDKIQTIFNEIQWTGEAADAYRNKFVTLKNSIVSSLENIKIQFGTLMEQTLADMQSAENANTVK